MINERNVNRLCNALMNYYARVNSFFPVDKEVMNTEITRVKLALLSRGTDVQSRINRLFSDNLEDETRTLIKLSTAISVYDNDTDIALGYLSGNII